MDTRHLLVPLLALLSLAATGIAQQPEGAFRWHDDLNAARALAHQQHKPLFVVFRCER
ncbi:MAG: hypothetical protein KAI24_11635 [Planctomycetes bacterium]|nr:hypothetical protein [Planctomycetota bacterium]